jgi:hypothetical protein
MKRILKSVPVGTFDLNMELILIIFFPTLPSSYLNAGSYQFASPLPLAAGIL